MGEATKWKTGMQKPSRQAQLRSSLATPARELDDGRPSSAPSLRGSTVTRDDGSHVPTGLRKGDGRYRQGDRRQVGERVDDSLDDRNPNDETSTTNEPTTQYDYDNKLIRMIRKLHHELDRLHHERDRGVTHG